MLQTISEIRKRSQIPIVLYIYYNLVHHYGPERFMRDAKITQIYEGTNQIQRMVIGRTIFGKV